LIRTISAFAARTIISADGVWQRRNAGHRGAEEGAEDEEKPPEEKKEILEHVLMQVVRPAITFSTEHIDRKVEIKALDGSRVGELELLRA
jgi:hypothetical protein